MAQGGTKRTSLRRATLTRASILIKNEEDNAAETDDQKRKRQFDYMTSDVLKARQKHLLAGQYFASLGNTVFVVSALITLFQAGLATVAQAEIVSEMFQSKVNITIALLSAFSVFWQSFAKHWDFGGKAGLHQSASNALGKIYNIANLRAREQQAVCLNKADRGGDDYGAAAAEHDVADKGGTSLSKVDEEEAAPTVDQDGATDLLPTDVAIFGGVGKDDDDPFDTIHDLGKNSSNVILTLTQQFEQATEGCSSSVPVQITAAFETLDARIGVCRRGVVNDGQSGINHKVRWEKVYPSLYTILTTTIISQPGWPFFLPNPEKVVDKAMEKYQKINTNLLETLLDRRCEIDKLYSRANETTPLV